MLARVVVVALLAAAAPANATDRRTHTVALPAGRTLSVAVTIGHVSVQGEPRADAVVDIVRTAPSADALARIPVSIDETPAEVRIVAEQADNGRDAAYRTDLTLRVPVDAVLSSIRVQEGKISLSSLAGSVTADLRRGPIEATNLQGTVRLETGIGDVLTSQMRLSANGLLRLRAFNGRVRLGLAERPAHARVMALALNGSITSDIPLTVREAWGPHWGETTLGNGEPVISLDVVTGRIEITTR